MPRLVCCENCSRHVFATESACPFCQAAITATPRAVPRVTRGLSRAQRLALTAALVAPLAGCADESADDAAAETDSASEELVAVPLYGVPVAGSRFTPVGGRGGKGGAGGAGGIVAVPLYGVPVSADDASLSTSTEEDAGVSDEEEAEKVEAASSESSLSITRPGWPTIPILLYGAPPKPFEDIEN